MIPARWSDQARSSNRAPQDRAIAVRGPLDQGRGPSAPALHGSPPESAALSDGSGSDAAAECNVPGDSHARLLKVLDVFQYPGS